MANQLAGLNAAFWAINESVLLMRSYIAGSFREGRPAAASSVHSGGLLMMPWRLIWAREKGYLSAIAGWCAACSGANRSRRARGLPPRCKTFCENGVLASQGLLLFGAQKPMT